MVLDAVSNFVRGNTDAEVGTDDTTVSVADASIFPDPETDGEFNVVIWDVDNFPRPDQDGDVEIMRVTERDTTADELTVVREQETTSAASHPEGSAIHLSPTAKMFSDIESTFGDFWDAGAQELTADVNNTNTTTTVLEADDVNGVVYQTANKGLAEALAEAGPNGVVVMTVDEEVDTDNVFSDGQTLIGNGKTITPESEAQDLDATNISLINVNFRRDRNGGSLFLTGSGIKLLGCKVINEDSGSSSRGLVVVNVDRFIVSNCETVAGSTAILVREDSSNGSVGNNIAEGGITIDSGATNINESNNTVI